MKLPLLAWAAAAIAATPQFFPLTRKGEVPVIEPYKAGQEVMLDCIARNIDTGEHMFDSAGRITYRAFPTCKETGKPLTLHYGVAEDINCTVAFTDELYHLFQLYVHEDAPFSCRVPLSTELNSLESGGAYVPLTFNLRGEVHNSHMDVDSRMNMLFTTPPAGNADAQTVVSAVAWSAGTRASRVTIGESLTFELAVRWSSVKPVGGVPAADAPFPDGFYKLAMASIPMSYSAYAASLLAVAALSALVAGFLGSRLKAPRYRHLDSESGVAKQD